MSETAYVADATIYCENCAPEGAAEFADGGGESDTPQHCDTCHQPLGNPLTSDGVAYVLEAAREELRQGRKTYLEVHPCYAGTYYEGSPHIAIVRDWMEDLEWYTLDERDAAFVSRFLSWTAHAMTKKES